MNRRLSLLSIIILLMVVVFNPVLAQDTSTVQTATPTPSRSILLVEDAFVRGGPGENYIPVGAITPLSPLNPVSRSLDGRWVLLRYGRGFGWLRRDLAYWVENIDNLPVIEANLTPSPIPGLITATPFFPTATPTGSHVNTVARSAYIRAGPGRTYLRLGQLFPGEGLEAVGRNRDTTWILIRFRDGFGWIGVNLGIWIEDLETLPVLTEFRLTPSPTFTPSNTPTATFTPSNTPTFTATATTTPTSTPSNTPTNTSTPTATATHTATSTNTPQPTATLTNTATFTPEPTATLTTTYTLEPTSTLTNTSTFTPQPTSTMTNTSTFTPEPTSTLTNTSTFTPQPTSTLTNTSTFTPKPSATNTTAPTLTHTSEPTVARTVATAAALAAASSTPVPSTSTHTPQPTLTQVPSTATHTAAPTDEPMSAFDITQTAVTGRLTEIAVMTVTQPAAVEVEPAKTATEEITPEVTATEEVIAVVTIPTSTPPTTRRDTEPDGGIPAEAIIGGIGLLAVLGYIGLYLRGIASSERYITGFPVQRCPVCRRGDLIVETKQERSAGIPTARHTVRCTECRSVLREIGSRRWRYAVDRLENPVMYDRFNNREVDEDTLSVLMEQPIVPLNPRPITPPDFVDGEDRE